MLWPLSSFSRDSATYSSYFFYEYEPIRKTIKPKTMPNKPPTYERTESNLPITRLTLKLLVDLNRLRVMNLEPTRETALVWNSSTKLPVSSVLVSIGQGLLSVSMVYLENVMKPVVPRFCENARKMFFSITWETGFCYFGEMMVSTTYSFTLK